MSTKRFDHIPGVIQIMGDLYAKTPEALELLLTELREIGYEIDNLREAKHREHDGVSVQTMEQNGWSLWFAKLDTRRAKCGSCGGYITTVGSRIHGATCSLCGAVIYREIIDGTRIRFDFIHRDGGAGIADLTMTAKRWDTEHGYLYFYPEVEGGLWLRGERAVQYFEDNSDKWEAVEEGGQRLIKIRYPQPWDYDVSAINPSETMGHEWNHKVVKVWDGKEYPEYFGDFPLPDTISIHEAWHWAPLPVTPNIHERIFSAARQVSRADYYYQDGRPAFSREIFAEMGKFVRHFTALDGKAWDRESRSFRLDGPGAIADVARFCHPDSVVRNEPNIGNLLVGFSKAFSGQELTVGELDAMQIALSDRGVREEFTEVVSFTTHDRGPQRLARKLPRRLKKALSKLPQQRTPGEQRLVRSYRRRFGGVAA